MRVMMRIPFVLLLLWVAGCASTRKPRPPAEDETEREQAPVERDGACEWRSTVTVHVDNQNSADVKIWFGYYTPARAAPGLSQTTYRVPRSYLSNDIQLRIERGGLQLGTPPPVATDQHVVCNDATLIIGPRLQYSFFYGDKLRD